MTRLAREKAPPIRRRPSRWRAWCRSPPREDPRCRAPGRPARTRPHPGPIWTSAAAAEHRDRPELLAQPDHPPAAHRLRAARPRSARRDSPRRTPRRALARKAAASGVPAHAPREREGPARGRGQGPDVPFRRAGEEDHVEALEAPAQGGGRRCGGHRVAQPIDGSLDSRVCRGGGGRDEWRPGREGSSPGRAGARPRRRSRRSPGRRWRARPAGHGTPAVGT